MTAWRKYFLQLAFCLLAFVIVQQAANAQQPIAKRNYVEIRKVPDSVVNKMKNDPAFAYANDSSYWKQRESDPGAFLKFINAISKSKFLKILLFIALAAGIIFAIYQVMVANNFFLIARRRRNAVRQADDSELSPENLDERILEETRNGNYRQAVRYMYLKTLKILSEYNFITLHAKSTNQDYIRQMYKHNSAGQFRQLTRIYEYVWYGEFDPSESQFDMIRTNFNQFNPRS